MRGMRRVNNDHVKQGDSMKLAADIDRFIENGGVIQEIASGVYGEKRVSLTRRQVLIAKNKSPGSGERV